MVSILKGMKLQIINMTKGNRMIRIGLGQNESIWFLRIDFWFKGIRVKFFKMGNILDLIFGNKIIVVTARRLGCFSEWEVRLVFHKKTPLSTITSTLFNLPGAYSIHQIKRYRTKKIPTPNQNQYKTLEQEHAIAFYD